MSYLPFVQVFINGKCKKLPNRKYIFIPNILAAFFSSQVICPLRRYLWTVNVKSYRLGKLFVFKYFGNFSSSQVIYPLRGIYLWLIWKVTDMKSCFHLEYLAPFLAH
jgi:hypothetical protein